MSNTGRLLLKRQLKPSATVGGNRATGLADRDVDCYSARPVLQRIEGVGNDGATKWMRG
jgi:hypothetical protein